MSYQLPPGEEKAAYVQTRFDAIARRYDLFNDLITQGQHRCWKNSQVKLAQAQPGRRGLDLCCGTGDIALRARAKMAGQGALVALDFSATMLSIAQERLKGAGAPLLVARGDAMRLPFADGSFDFVTVGFGLRNVADLPGALDEILRVLKPGGLLASLDVGKVANPLVRPLADFYFFHMVPLIGRLLQPGEEMFSYLPHSSVPYPGQEALKALLLQRGFASVSYKNFLFGSSVIHLAKK